jgi:competence protein ComEC
MMSAAGSAQPAGQVPVQKGGHSAAGADFPVSRNNRDWMAAHYIDVGQGSATLFEFSCGLLLVDTGGQSSGIDGRARLTSYLEAVFKRRPDLNRTIDVIFITHPHRDHTNGITPLLDQSK